MKKVFSWLKERLFHEKHDAEILHEIEKHRQLTRATDEKITDFIAALDGEIDWFKRSCTDSPRGHRRSTDHEHG